MAAALAFLSRLDLRVVLVGLLIVALAGSWVVVRHKDRQIAAAQVELATSKVNVRTLEASIAEQNAAVDAAAAEFRARQVAVTKAIESAPRPRARVATAMAEPARGRTVADRVEDIDRRFLEAIR